jgi:hypothetical protein
MEPERKPRQGQACVQVAGALQNAGVYRPRNPRASPLWQCARRHGGELREAGRFQRAVEERAIERFIECGDPHHGFARIYCDACGHDYLLAFSCKTRYFCPSCHQKRVLLYGEWVEKTVLVPVPHRQYVFTLPRLIRHFFGRRRAWFGDLVNFNPHLHVLAADGAFLPGGRFIALPRVPASLLAESLRRAVLDFLVENEALSEELRARMLAWRHSGFSAHNEVSVAAEDAEGRKKLAGYMLRAPMSLQKMTYDAATGTVIYRSRMHAGLKRNFQVMSGAAWLELLCRHIPDRYEHLVRYAGWYSNRARGERAKKALPYDGLFLPSSGEAPATEFAARAKAAWARLIRKVYEADPLECPRCKGPMRVIALIEDPGVIRRILNHLGLWAPLATKRSPPPGPAASWPRHANLPLTYHPVPDIA